jgi:hypothetical protein
METTMIQEQGGGSLLAEFADGLRVRSNIHNVVVTSTTAFLKSFQDYSAGSQPSPLGPFIDLFDAQLVDILTQCRSGLSEHGSSPMIYLRNVDRY